MLRKSFFRVLALFTVMTFVGATVGQAEVVITKPSGRDYKNPTLFVAGITGDAEVAKIAADNLRLCGWFDPARNAAEADFVINGQASSSSLQLTVAGRASFVMTQPLPAADRNHYIRKGVDMVLNKIFGIRGICATRIAFSVKSGRAKNIYIADFDGRDVKQITHHNNLCVEAEWTPDARSLIYTMYGNSNTDIIQTIINPLRSRLLVRMPGLNCGASVSPNGRMLALIASRDKQVELYVKPINGSTMTRLTRSRAVEASPCWSSDSAKICFVSDLGRRRPGIFVINAAGGTPQQQPTIGEEAVSPHMSSNGSIVYSCKSGGHYTLAIISKDPKVPSGVIVNQSGDWESPCWAPDNRHVICARNDGRGTSSLYIVDTWTLKTRLYLKGYDMTYPSWSNVY
ncbi:MAG: hypothetical protein PHQ27_07535 [Victivallales bacterium]|nr:hypothetical protein [Victivallales bacterium]